MNGNELFVASAGASATLVVAVSFNLQGLLAYPAA
jgi:hypothetical protein